MKCIRYILALLAALMIATACSDDTIAQRTTAPEGTPITLRFVADVPKHHPATRGVGDVENLTLLVFDENHRYLYRATAVLGAVVSTNTTDVVRPEGGATNGINEPVPDEKREISVTLLSSPTKKRIIHFVANYDFTSVPPDYKLENMDESELMLSLYQEGEKPEVYWQVFDFPTLGENSFDQVQFRLLRNQAKVSVEVDPSLTTFKLLGFCINNAPDKGTVAPFAKRTAPAIDAYNDPRGVYNDVLYLFPRDPKASTTLPNYSLSPKGYQPNTGTTLNNRQPLFVYEYCNKEAEIDRQMSIIVYGQMQGKAPGYYKIDLAQRLVDNNGHYMGSKPYDIVRNFSYVATIKKVNDAGYPTYEKAVSTPAGNNLYASVEAEHYSSVSNGKYALVVDNTDAIMLLPGHFSSNVTFTNATGQKMSDRVEVYLNERLCNGPIIDDEYISYANYNTTLGKLTVHVDKIPEGTEKEYIFTAIGKGEDGSYIQRNISLKLHPRYKFNLKLIEPQNATTNPQGERVDLEFTVPGTLHYNLFPYPVYIAADYLSPYVSEAEGINDGMKIVKKGSRIYYEYMVKTPPANGLDERRTIHFKRTMPDKSAVVTMFSEYYHDSDVLLKEVQSVNGRNRALLYYTGFSYTEPRLVSSGLRTKIKVENVSGWGDYIPTARMVTAGYLEVTSDNTYYINTQIKLTATISLAGGEMECTKTMTISEWRQVMRNTSADAKVVLDIDNITIEGDMSLSDWYTNAREWERRGDLPIPAGMASSAFTITNSLNNPAIRSKIEILSQGKYRLTITGLATIKEPVSFSVKFRSGNINYQSAPLYIGKLLDDPMLVVPEYYAQ